MIDTGIAMPHEEVLKDLTRYHYVSEDDYRDRLAGPVRILIG